MVFNIGGNKYRVILAIDYQRQLGFIRFVGTRAQYDQINPGRAAKPDHWKSVTRTKLPTAFQAHKPADSGVPVGSGARICRHRDVTRFDFKQPWRTTCKSLENRGNFRRVQRERVERMPEDDDGGGAAVIGFACSKRPLTLALSRGRGDRSGCSCELRRPEPMRRTHDKKRARRMNNFNGSQQ